MKQLCSLALLLLAACSGESGSNGTTDANVDGDVDGNVGSDAQTANGNLGVVTNVMDMTMCGSSPATCKKLTVTGCPGIETEPLDATIRIEEPATTPVGTIVHFIGGGGEGFQRLVNVPHYTQSGFREVFVSWAADWEKTASHGIKTAACRPATVIKWIFDEPTIHAGSRTQAFCGEGFSGGSAQLGYAIAHYGMGEYLDYVNELSGPPFARLDLGCDGNAPSTALVCGESVTTHLPGAWLDDWENIQPPNSCGGTTNTPAEIERWKNDSITIGGVYNYPQTRVELFDCTNQATVVTGMSQIFHDTITSEKDYHCYSQADGCMGEALGMTGNSDAATAITTGCVPRHM